VRGEELRNRRKGLHKERKNTGNKRRQIGERKEFKGDPEGTCS